jgi:hypothetical protein
MRRDARVACAALGLAALTAAGPVVAASAGCRNSPKVVAPCFTVRGRLLAANGAPTFRLRRIGTHRTLGVVGDTGDENPLTLLPPSLEARMKPPTPGPYRTVYGDFRVCPLTRARPGRMQFVCIDRASHVVVAKNQGDR